MKSYQPTPTDIIFILKYAAGELFNYIIAHSCMPVLPADHLSSVAEVWFSPVQTPFCPNLNLNLLQIF